MRAQTRLLITGGTGFFGLALLRYLKAQFASGGEIPLVTSLSRDPAGFTRRHSEFFGLPWLRFSQGDICDPGSLPRGVAFTHIIHAAADSTRGPQLSPLQRFDQIVNGTRNVLDLAIECKAERFLLTSSGAVYGVQPADMDYMPEDWMGMPDPLNPNSAYGVAKRSAEHLCALYGDAFGLETVIARCFAFVGPDLPLDAHFAVGNFIRDALWNERITVTGDGTAERSYLDQRDLAHWLHELLFRGRPAQAYNVGSDVGISIGELAHLVRDILAPSKPVSVRDGAIRCEQRNRYVPNVEKIRNDLDLQQSISIEQSIIKAANALSIAISTTFMPPESTTH
jgi:dTDP-glucose 4,6-dehydratase